MRAERRRANSTTVGYVVGMSLIGGASSSMTAYVDALRAEGVAAQQAMAINTSLSALGNCIYTIFVRQKPP